MSTMNELEARYHVVFLIDTRLGVCNESFNSEKVSILIREAALKLLTYFSTIQKEAPVEWGFKFFNWSTRDQVTSKKELRPLDVNGFEDFEEFVNNAIDLEFSKNHNKRSVKSPHKRSKTKHSQEEYGTLTTLTDALKETVYDFKWITPNISSPLSLRKRKGLKKLFSNNNSESRNFVFLISPIPSNCEDFKDYFEIYKRQISVNDVFDQIFGSLLYEKFHCENHIRLFWIDIRQQYVSSPEEGYSGSLELLNSALNKVEGGVIPINALLQLGLPNTIPVGNILSLHSDNIKISSKEVPDSKECRLQLPLPFSSVINYYLNPAKQQNMNNTEVHEGFLSDIAGNKLCYLSLESLLTKTAKGQQEEQIQDKCTIKISTSKPQTHLRSPRKLANKQFMVKNDTKSNLSTQQQQDNSDSSAFKMIGTISTLIVPYECFKSSSVYTCVGKNLNNSGTDCRSTVFERLLLILAQQKLVLIVSYSSRQICLLQPITLACASITCLSNESSMLVEKMLCLPKHVEVKTEDLRQFVGKSVDHFMSSLAKVKNSKTDRDITCSSEAPTSTTTNIAGTVENWYFPKPTTQLLTSEPRSARSSLMNDLQLLYKKEKCPPFMYGMESVQQAPIEQTEDSKEENKKENVAKSKNIAKELGLNLNKESTLKHVRSLNLLKKGKSHQGQQKKSLSPNKNILQKNDQPKTKANEQPTVDFSDEDGLISYITSCYESAIDKGSDLLLQAQSLISLVLHFAKTKNSEQAQEYSKTLLNDNLIQTTISLRKKYLAAIDVEDLQEKKTKEYELQVLIQMEISSVLCTEELSEDDFLDLSEEIAQLITAAFIGNPPSLQHFLEEILVENYSQTCGKLLAAVYLELGQNPPLELMSFLSPGESQSPLSVKPGSQQPTSVKSLCSIRSASSNPASNRSRRVLRHSSMLDVSNSQRQIIMPVIKPGGIAKKINDDKKEKKMTIGATIETKIITRSATKRSKKQDLKLEVRKVRRNLFTGEKLEKRQSDSAIEIGLPKRHYQRHSTTSRGRVLKTKMVAETPSHKQVSQVIQRKIEKQRQRSHTVSELVSVGESPDKAGQSSSATITLNQRASFYSVGNQVKSRNIEKYHKLSQRMSRPFASPSKIIAQTPRRTEVKSVLFSQLLASPSCSKSSDSQRPSGSTTATSNQSLYTTPKTKHEVTHTTPNSVKQFISNEPVNESLTPKQRRITVVKRLTLDSPVLKASSSEAKNECIFDTPAKYELPATTRMCSPRHCASIYKSPLHPLMATPTKGSPKAPKATAVKHMLCTAEDTPARDSPTFGSRSVPKSSKLQSEKQGIIDKYCYVETSQKVFTPKRKSSKQETCPSCSKNGESTCSRSETFENVETDKRTIQTRMCNFTPKPCETESAFEHEFTPPSSKKRKIKTPDSFDSWHRRKQRRNDSPSFPKTSLGFTNVKTLRNEKNLTKEIPTDEEVSFPVYEKQGFNLNDPNSVEKLNCKITEEEQWEESGVLNFPFYERQGYNLWDPKSAEKLNRKVSSELSEDTSDMLSETESSANKNLSQSQNYFSSENEDVFLSGEEKPGTSKVSRQSSNLKLRLNRKSSGSWKITDSSGYVTRTKSVSKSFENEQGVENFQKIENEYKSREIKNRKFSPFNPSSIAHLVKSPLLMGCDKELTSTAKSGKGLKRKSKSRRTLYQ